MSVEQPSVGGRPVAGPGADIDSEQAVARRLQILSTEHWSLLATRSLTYSESFSRANMFFTVLTGAVVALALVAQAMQFSQTFLIAAILVLSIVLFVGLATIGRLQALNRDDILWVTGMNRLRHAYLELHPELAPYFVSSPHDDPRGALVTLGFADVPVPGRRILTDLAHGLQTLPGMIGVVVSMVGGTLTALVAVALTVPSAWAIAVGAAGFLVTFAVIAATGQSSAISMFRQMAPRFPSAD